MSSRYVIRRILTSCAASACALMLQAVFATPAKAGVADTALPDCGGKYGRILSTPNVSSAPIGMEREVEVGGTLLSTSEGSIMELGLSLKKPASVSGRMMGANFVVTIPPTEFNIQNSRVTGLFAAPEATFRYERESKERRGFSRPDIFISSDPENPSALILHVSFGLSSQRFPIADTPFEQVRCLGVSPKRFRREILYSGSAKGVVTLQYREFQNNLAGPAFSQELTYDLSDGNEIGFKGARITVIKVSNLGLRYAVMKALDE
ncbi:MAG: hypothetical protein V4530_02005 [Pseudomonadota bacterium]